MENSKISVTHLKKNFGKLEVLKGISLEVKEGEVVCLIGPSGSGKSTFLRCLNRLEKITAGEVIVDGHPISDPNVNINKVRENIGMVFQHFNLFPNMTIKKNITLAPTQLGLMSKEDADKKALELLERVGLLDKADSYPDMLSGGQKQRLSIARAIAKKPEIFIFDDSFSALDFKTDSTLRKALKEHTKDATTIIVAQRISTILNADKIIVLDDGHMAGIGTHGELMKNCEVYRQIAMSQLSEEELA